MCHWYWQWRKRFYCSLHHKISFGKNWISSSFQCQNCNDDTCVCVRTLCIHHRVRVIQRNCRNGIWKLTIITKCNKIPMLTMWTLSLLLFPSFHSVCHIYSSTHQTRKDVENCDINPTRVRPNWKWWKKNDTEIIRFFFTWFFQCQSFNAVGICQNWKQATKNNNNKNKNLIIVCVVSFLLCVLYVVDLCLWFVEAVNKNITFIEHLSGMTIFISHIYATWLRIFFYCNINFGLNSDRLLIWTLNIEHRNSPVERIKQFSFPNKMSLHIKGNHFLWLLHVLQRHPHAAPQTELI